MSNMMIKIIVFTIIFNISAGIMMEAIPSFKTGSTDDVVSGEGGIVYVENGSNNFITIMEDQVNPAGNLEDKSDAIDRLLDTIGIGYIKRILEAVKSYLYGFVSIFDNMLGGYLAPGVYVLLFGKPFGLLYSVTTLIYILGGYTLWTGRSVRAVR